MVTKTFSPKDYLKLLSERRRATPALIVDLAVLRDDFQQFLDGFSGVRIFYAAKANPHPMILRTLNAMGAHFEISSLGEFRHLRSLRIAASRIITSNPVKTSAFIAEASREGVGHFAFDSTTEVDKFAEAAPGAKLSVRLTVPNTGSDWPLDKKFGVSKEQALTLMEYARFKGCRPAGVAFHVGSQCRNLASWIFAMGEARDFYDRCLALGIKLEVVNVGGGMPIVYDRDDVPAIRSVGATILEAYRQMFPPEVQLWVEPGRAVIGRAGTMVTTVVGTAYRNGVRWVYLDAGIFHGLAEALGGIKYRYFTETEGPMEPCTIAGPSCDSVDVIQEKVMLPPVRPGDTIVIPACGAYTTVYASNFNGFPGPDTIVVNGSSNGTLVR